MIITGVIESIEYRKTAGHEKKVVTLLPDERQRAFVEFRGRKMEKLDGVKEGDKVSVKVILEGKTSKNSGINYNNLVCTELVVVNKN